MNPSKLLFTFFMVFGFVAINAQGLDELKNMKTEKESAVAGLQGQIDALNGEIGDLNSQINKLSGWRKGISGLVGFDFNNSSNWVASPNRSARSSALNIGITGFANKDTEKSFWNNKLLITKSFQDVDITEADRDAPDDGLFNNGTVDILNLSSLYGYKLSDAIAISALGELNTSLGNFLEPGTMDIGAGITYTGIENLVVVVHPLNYHIAWPAIGSVSSTGALGAKIRADYTRDFMLSGKKVAWSSTFTTFFPYSDTESTVPVFDKFGVDTGATANVGVAEWTWLNTLSFEVWNGIGVGVNFGIRKADFESLDTQNFYSLGLTYAL